MDKVWYVYRAAKDNAVNAWGRTVCRARAAVRPVHTATNVSSPDGEDKVGGECMLP